MEKRKMKISYNRSGNGGLNPKISLPITFTRELGATEDDREVFIYQVAGEIIITKEAIMFDEKKVTEMLIKEVEKEIKEGFIWNGEGSTYIYDLIKKAAETFAKDNDEAEDLYEEYENSICDSIIDYLMTNYKYVNEIDKRGDAKIYYYDNCFNFKTVEELEKHFLIGE